MLRLALSVFALVSVHALAIQFDTTLNNEWEMFKVTYRKSYGEEEFNR
jgi:hypothetical protein